MIGQGTHPGILGAHLIADEIEEMVKKEEAKRLKDFKEKREKIQSQTSEKTTELISA